MPTDDELYNELEPIAKPVCVVDQAGDRPTVIKRFETIRQAEQFIETLEITMPEDVHAGRFGIDAPETMVNPKLRY